LKFNLWIDSLTKPIQTFKKEKNNANLFEGMMHIAIAGLITGFLSGLKMLFESTFLGMLGSTYGGLGSLGLFGAIGFIASIILTPIFSVIIWLIVSGILYIFAMMLGGKGSYTTQSYLYAIYLAPLNVIVGVFSLIPFVGGIIAILPMLYGLYLLTLVLKETHQYTLGKAVLTWAIPVIILTIILFILAVIIGFALLTLFMGTTTPYMSRI